MLTYSFTNIGSDSLYHHLYQCIREDILCGNLTAETKLPSKRSFAKNLGVSNITVENAYAQLQAEGYIYSIPKNVCTSVPGSTVLDPIANNIFHFEQSTYARQI